MTVLGAFDARWLVVAIPLLLAGACVCVYRQLLATFSRKRLGEIVPEARRAEVDAHLEREDSYTASLRSFDLLLRLCLVLSLAFARILGDRGVLFEASFGETLAEFAVLALAIGAVFLVFLEIVPGVAARVRTEEKLLKSFGAIRRIDAVFGPLRSISASAVRSLSVLLGGWGERPTADVLEDEILSAAEEGQREGLLKSREIDMIESIITFGNVEVSEVMTPRTEMVCLDADDPIDENIRKAIECGHSRIPVYEESKDNIIGLLYVKDLLRYWDRKESIRLRDVLRKPHFVPLTKKIGELFQEFKTQRFHIAIVLDEFGGTLGLVTIEDIIEEIVGEITDEYEKGDKPAFKVLAPGLAEVDAAVRIDEFNDQFGTEIPEAEAYDTIGGFVVSQLGKIPSVGESLEFSSIRFEVTSGDERRIRRLRVRLPQRDEGKAG